MSEQQSYGMRSLRFKLILASIAVEAVMLSLLVWNSARITSEAIQETFQDQLETLVPMMVVGLANPLAQRDYAELEERLGKMINPESLVYVELRDERGKAVASRGAVPEVVHLDSSFDELDHVYDQAFDIVLADKRIGRARYGLNTSHMEATVKDLRNQGILVASAAIGLTIALLVTLGALLTHRLRALSQAARTLTSGNYRVRVPVVGRDEVADTAIAFNAMADTLARDIADRKQAERTLKESEERFRATFEQAAVGIAQVRPDGRWLQVNQKLCDIVGYRRAELLQCTFQDITHPEDLDADLASVRRMLAGEIQTYSMEKRYIRKDSSQVWICLTVGLVRQPTGEPKYFIAVVEDISERKRAQMALQQSGERLRNIVDGLGPSMFVGLLDLEGVVLEANQQALAAAGLKREDVLGQPVEETYWFSYSEASKQHMRDMIAQGVRGEATRCDLEIRVAENQYIDLDFSMQPYRDASGKVTLLVPSAVVITERKQAEAKLHQNEERLRLALDAAHMGTFDWDIPNKHITRSRWHEELWGFNPGEFNGTYEALSERVHPDDLPRVDAEVARCIAAREPFMCEFRVVWPDGSTHWIASHGEFTFDIDGQPSRMHGVVREITALKRAEILLSGEKKVLEMTAEGAALSTILETVTRNVESGSNDTRCSILLLDADGVHLQHGAAPSLPESYNRAIHGMAIGPKAGSCGTAVYRNQPVIVTDIATDPLWDDYRALALPHGLRACWSMPIRSGGGQVLGSFAMYYPAPRSPGPADYELIARATHLSAIAIERRHAERALQESEERLRLALEAAHMGTFDWDIPNNRITWSHWHEELWGYMPGEFGGTYEAFSERVHPDDVPTIDTKIAHCIAERKPYQGEFRVVWPDGSVHWISGRGEFTFGADNEPQRMRGAVVEITERKQAEAGLLDAKENLEHKVIERTAELEAIQRELHAKNEELIKQNRRVEEANRLKSEFLANMSHELRTPLNAIIGFSELMHDGKVGPIASNHKEYLGDVLTSAQHLLHLINDVLDLAKVEAGKMEFHYAPMDLRKVIGEVCEILRTMTSRTRIQVAIDVDKDLSEVWGDASKLKQVLYNYLSNALKFSPEGGQVRVRARREGRDAYRIEVADQGIGIKTEDIPRLFQEFQQLDLSASKKYQGTGLGLALTKRIIEAQGGCVGVESIRGHGSIFYAVLPLRNAVTESALSLNAPGL